MLTAHFAELILSEDNGDLFVRKILPHKDVLALVMKTLLTFGLLIRRK